MKYLLRARDAFATLLLGLGLAKLFGSIPFSPHATAVLVRIAAWFGVYGDEQVEDMFMLVSALLALLIAALLVRLARAMLAARKQR